MLKCSVVIVALLARRFRRLRRGLPHPHFQKSSLSDQFWSEGANFGDFNHDGVNGHRLRPVLARRPRFQEAPRIPSRRQILHPQESRRHWRKKSPATKARLASRIPIPTTSSPSSMISTATAGRTFSSTASPALDASWYENPKGREGHWQRHVIFNTVDNESPTQGDINGDGKPGNHLQPGGYFGYASADWAHPEKPWTFHPISPAATGINSLTGSASAM